MKQRYFLFIFSLIWLLMMTSVMAVMLESSKSPSTAYGQYANNGDMTDLGIGSEEYTSLPTNALIPNRIKRQIDGCPNCYPTAVHANPVTKTVYHYRRYITCSGCGTYEEGRYYNSCREYAEAIGCPIRGDWMSI